MPTWKDEFQQFSKPWKACSEPADDCEIKKVLLNSSRDLIDWIAIATIHGRNKERFGTSVERFMDIRRKNFGITIKALRDGDVKLRKKILRKYRNVKLLERRYNRLMVKMFPNVSTWIQALSFMGFLLPLLILLAAPGKMVASSDPGMNFTIFIPVALLWCTIPFRLFSFFFNKPKEMKFLNRLGRYLLVLVNLWNLLLFAIFLIDLRGSRDLVNLLKPGIDSPLLVDEAITAISWVLVATFSFSLAFGFIIRTVDVPAIGRLLTCILMVDTLSTLRQDPVLDGEEKILERTEKKAMVYLSLLVNILGEFHQQQYPAHAWRSEKPAFKQWLVDAWNSGELISSWSGWNQSEFMSALMNEIQIPWKVEGAVMRSKTNAIGQPSINKDLAAFIHGFLESRLGINPGNLEAEPSLLYRFLRKVRDTLDMSTSIAFMLVFALL